MTEIKDMRDVKKDFGYTLKWTNGYGDDFGTEPYHFYLEDINTYNRIEITDTKALDYITDKTTNAFRKGVNIYDVYEELFKIMGIKKRG